MQSQIREQEAAERGISVWARMPQEARNAIYRAILVAVSAMLPDLTFEKLQLDLDNLEKAEAAYETEANREYDFEEPVEVLTEPQAHPVES
jgi:hypothetical protein